MGVLVQIWASEATVQSSVMGQKQDNQKAVVVHSCGLNPLLSFLLES